ncbi:hypothetical protein Taro_038384 [Colocasia esculenta]|uniref:Uncharacterized protein n=1 Tax=Colocasia esculenta TaxID=4460 RepID=A0A843WFQ4_COLES|nr:hypothetical protein [Colocasia esculenta]
MNIWRGILKKVYLLSAPVRCYPSLPSHLSGGEGESESERERERERGTWASAEWSREVRAESELDRLEMAAVTASILFLAFSPGPGVLRRSLSLSDRTTRWRAEASQAAPSVGLETLQAAINKEDSDAVRVALDQLNQTGWAKKWNSQPYVSCRTTSLRELTTLGIKNAENLAIPSLRNDAAFLFTVVGTTGFLAVLAGQLPGDWGFFVPYLIGSISLVVLAVGSISPGLLQAAIGGFSSFFPDYQERITAHEAAHFLDVPNGLSVAYLIGLPILGYSLDIGKEHVNLLDERLQQLIYSGKLDGKELDSWAVAVTVSMEAISIKAVAEPAGNEASADECS